MKFGIPFLATIFHNQCQFLLLILPAFHEAVLLSKSVVCPFSIRHLDITDGFLHLLSDYIMTSLMIYLLIRHIKVLLTQEQNFSKVSFRKLVIKGENVFWWVDVCENSERGRNKHKRNETQKLINHSQLSHGSFSTEYIFISNNVSWDWITSILSWCSDVIMLRRGFF